MKTQFLSALTISAALGLASVSTGALAAESDKLLGAVAPSAQADRTVSLTGGTSKVLVNWGETVNFLAANGQKFTVKFDGVRSAFNLQDLVPAAALNRPVDVYVRGGLSKLGA
ncbi:CzcE family metal-binding protein [Bordetella sp. FB-8]|uniref:CzcE family metal-binding protein n=1 Tax=Bordetella sp. FB-8 TaxID=1159870 RepID=UPI00036181E4|nr:CzcE family metal-binding protein [Bordetella sp. FB-8]